MDAKEKYLRENDIAAEFCDAFCGELIGKGGTRQVYECLMDMTKVIKIETTGGGNETFFCENRMEFDVWNTAFVAMRYKKWLAPVHYLSPNNRILIQSRTEPMHWEDLPKKVPDFLGDLKLSNWGMLDGKPVCHDYGCNRPVYVGLTEAKMVDAKYERW